MLKVVIVGAGRGGTSLLRAFRGMEMLRVIGVADQNLGAPGIRLAREFAIPVAYDFRELVFQKDVDIIVNATGSGSVEAEIRLRQSARAVLIEGLAMNLMLHLVDEEEKLVRALRAQQQERDVILNSTHDAMLAVNGQGLVTICNRAAERLLGIRREGVLDRPAVEVIPNTRLHLLLRSGQSELNQQQRVGETTIVTNRVAVRDEHGEITGAVAVFRDISEVKALATEISGLREMKTLLEAIINATQDAISVVDAEGIGIMVNPAYCTLTGMTPEQVIGKPATVDIDPSQESMHMRVLRTRRAVRGIPMTVGPRNREVVVNVAPMMVDGQLKGSVGVVHDVSEIVRLTAELEQQKKLVRRLTTRYTFDEIVADSAVMQSAVEQARRAAETPATVLLRGESGTGKELFAHAIHNASGRKRGQFVRVNCAAIADSLLESELFGYVEGAFTGARKGGRKGLFEEAGGGTIFLDEIGELSHGLQAKLLRVLQEKEIVRVGDSRALSVDTRVIAATNAPLEELIAKGRFREDLYYRLNVVPIVIPPVRHRKEDIPKLVEHLIAKLNGEYGRHVQAIDPEALGVLLEYHWPGNVRELENMIGRAMIAMGFHDTIISKRFLPVLAEVRLQEGAQTRTDPPVGTLAQAVAATERAAIVQTLRLTAGNKTEAARRLGVAPRTLYYKLERYGLPD